VIENGVTATNVLHSIDLQVVPLQHPVIQSVNELFKADSHNRSVLSDMLR